MPSHFLCYYYARIDHRGIRQLCPCGRAQEASGAFAQDAWRQALASAYSQINTIDRKLAMDGLIPMSHSEANLRFAPQRIFDSGAHTVTVLSCRAQGHNMNTVVNAPSHWTRGGGLKKNTELSHMDCLSVCPYLSVLQEIWNFSLLPIPSLNATADAKHEIKSVKYQTRSEPYC